MSGSVLPYAGARDATIRKAEPTTNFGSEPDCRVRGGAEERSCLLRWDLTSLPTTAVVQYACIELYASDPSVRTFDSRELKRSWTDSQVTWNNAATGAAWATPGAKGSTDRDERSITSFVQTEVGSISSHLERDVVQRWIQAPSNNFGITLANSAAYDGITFASAEAATVSHRPALFLVIQ
jgi:hypothetical protein